MTEAVVKGHLDGLEGPHEGSQRPQLVGWAFNTSGDSCQIHIVDDSDTVVAKGVASLERDDLAVLAQGRTNFAFRIPLPSLEGVRHLRVLADGVEVLNSPLNVGGNNFDGRFLVRGGRIEGWIAERLPQFTPPHIVIEDQDGDIVFEGGSRFPLEPGSEFNTVARFAGELADRCFGCGELRLRAFANKIQFAELLVNLPLSTNLETITANRCSGWVTSPEAPKRVFEIDVFRDGEFVAATKCNLQRDDVSRAILGATHSGFDVTLPPVRPPRDRPTRLSFRLRGSDIDLFEGPYLVAARSDLIMAARSLSAAFPPDDRASDKSVAISAFSSAIADFVVAARENPEIIFKRQAPELEAGRIQLNIVIPVYRNLAITKACIESVLSHRNAETDRIVVINDNPNDAEMVEMLRTYLNHRSFELLSNEVNLGYVKSANRGISFCTSGDIVLLNADTEVFAGGLREMWRVARADPRIGTVTAISNNATLFSYPHADLRRSQLDDISWQDLAALTLERNSGRSVDFPTGHGFCMLIKQEVIRRIGSLDEAFGRGYGEENDFCMRSADLGYRNVIAPGALVVHHESLSFANEKYELLRINIPKLERRYPEYTPVVMAAERRDDLRVARWELDTERLRRASEAGQTFILVVQHSLGGGTHQAIADIEASSGYGAARKIELSCRPDGYLQVQLEAPLIKAMFAPDESAELMRLISATNIEKCIVHQVLGFPAQLLNVLGDWLSERHGVYYVHDYYALCPRVTMIDAHGQFCGLSPPELCARCVNIGGGHDGSRMSELTPAAHRDLFSHFLGKFEHVVAPSNSAAAYLRRVFHDLNVEVAPHPERHGAYPEAAREGADNEVVLVGALGPHKGSARLLEIAQIAQIRDPTLRFRVVGYTDRDDELLRLGNVTITGRYVHEDLGDLLERSRGRLALFLSGWPETYSYTLSEVVRHGFIPLVPDIGAPAERVREAGFGAIFPFPIVAGDVLGLISGISKGRIRYAREGAGPRDLAPSAERAAQTTRILAVGPLASLVEASREEPEPPQVTNMIHIREVI